MCVLRVIRVVGLRCRVDRVGGRRTPVEVGFGSFPNNADRRTEEQERQKAHGHELQAYADQQNAKSFSHQLEQFLQA